MWIIRNSHAAAALAVISGLYPAARAQTAQSGPAEGFEVATVKPHNPDIPGFGISLKGRRLSGVNVSVSSLMAFAYNLHPRQIVDAPGWAERERFDVTAEAPEGGQASMKLLTQMLLFA